MRQLAVELGSTDRGRRNYLKASTTSSSSSSSNIESDEEFFGFE
jgi:hypothetical protein